MSFKNQLAACAAYACLAFTSVSALADDHAYTEGAVVNVSSIRTVDGKFDDYMKARSSSHCECSYRFPYRYYCKYYPKQQLLLENKM